MKKTVLTISMAISAMMAFSQNYSNGLFLVNEGNFGSNDGDISFYDNETQILYEDVFQTENPTQDGFDVLQDFEIFEGKGYFISKGASDHQLVITDANTFELQNTIGLETDGPQSITMISESKAYLSCTNAPTLRVLDIEGDSISHAVGSSVGSFSAQDYISVYEDNAYIFMGSKLAVIDTELDSAYSEIELLNAEISCSGMCVSGQKLFVLTNSGWSGSSSRLFRVDLLTNEVELNLDLSTLGKARLLQSDGNNLYFMVANDVYKMSKESDIAPTNPFATSGYSDSWDLAYGKSFLVDAQNEKILIGSAEGYVADGSYEILNLTDGSLISNQNSSGGIGLNQFISISGPNNLVEFPVFEFSLYPNPAIDYLMIELRNDGNTFYQLIDLEGRILLSGDIKSERQKISVSYLPEGAYFLKLISSFGISSKKVIIY